MFSALHPALLGGLSLVAVPVLIHLLLRKRPRPRPWAAMRWLLAAARKAQRQYRLTNLLLLLCRCLIVAAIALAVTRPTLAGLGGGSRLVLIVDRTASMGARGADPGPLAAAKSALAQAHLDYASATLIAVDARVEEIAQGSPRTVIDALSSLDTTDLPGGLDAASHAPAASDILALCGHGADVVLVSDFAQDDGAALSALLAPACRTVSRWRTGSAAANAAIAGVDGIGEQSPGVAGELLLRVEGRASQIALAVDDGPFVPAGTSQAGGERSTLRVSVPPLPQGSHRLRVRLNDESLAYDNLLELPIVIRPRIDVLTVQQEPDFVTAALHAEDRSFAFTASSPAQFPAQALPARGVVALRGAVANGARLHDWVVGGGVLWADARLIAADPALKDLLKGLEFAAGSAPASTAMNMKPGGPYTSGEADIDEVLSIATAKQVPAVSLPHDAEVLLRAGKEPVVVALPAGRGWVVAELADLASDRDLEARGTAPLWVVRTARRLAARLDSPRFWTAGLPAPAEEKLTRAGESATIAAGEALMLAPGAWTSEKGPTVVVLPNPDEGRLDRPTAVGVTSRIDDALPKSSGADLGLLLAILALVIAIGEGLFAAWAARTYGS